ncbi:MAG: RecQ family ATP-dependent DNA helicase [Terriglobales bacterium]
MVSNNADLLGPLRRYWGYDSFRPLQERIVQSLLGGRDACVIMPTGGGKSLCYQLPAVLSEKTAVVISPLIALMQDQGANLAQMGIPSAVLNSFQSSAEQSKIMRQARDGQYRLLYLSPERLAREDTIGWLTSVPIAFFAIDEAHCISEWGHEFRPEYRQLSRLRSHFPQVPIAAFTASATRQVRHDIVHQLALRNPDKYIASFHRANLRYAVHECEPGTQLSALVPALRYYAGGNVIVYAPTIRRVEETTEYLLENGIAAVPYHGKMEAGMRRQNQERWMSDEVRVLVGTIAFGLGINKATVRAVLHLSLPKSIEQYYQEAGRAGRDGRPADCVLLWQKQDSALLHYFIEKIGDDAERERSWQRYHIMRGYADAKSCRQRQICVHFGETPKWQRCDGCDNCGTAPEWLRFADVRPARRRTMLVPAPEPTGTVSGPLFDQAGSALSEYLREWRRALARERNIPAYLVMHDTTLESLCRRKPRTLAELQEVGGIGERKADIYGPEILQAIRNFENGARATPTVPINAPAKETLRLLAQGHTFEEIARLRARELTTVISTVANLIETGRLGFQAEWVPSEKQQQIEAVCERLGVERLRPIKDALPEAITFDDIRLVVARLRARKTASSKSPSPAA